MRSPVTATLPQLVPDPGGRARSVNHRRTRSHHRRSIIVAVVAVAVVISVLFPGGRHQWAVSLFRQPSRYTVLAFNDPANLPDRARFDQRLTVAFNISNYEGRTEVYRYVLSEDSKGTHRLLGASALSVAADRSATVVTTVRPSCPNSPCRIEVSLPGHPDTIDFLVRLVTQRSSPARRGRNHGPGDQASSTVGGA